MGEKIPDDLRKAAHNAYADLFGCDNMTERREVLARALLAERMAERERLAERLDVAADSFDAAAIHDGDPSRVAAHRACEKLCNSLARSIRNQEKP